MARNSGLLFFAVTLLGGTPAPSPTDLLRDALTAPQRVSYVGEVQVLRIGAQHSDATIYRVEHRAPDLTRRWYLAPQDLYGDSTISRGSTNYSIDVKRQRVVVSQGEDADQQIADQGNFDILMANYHAVYAPDENLSGRSVHVVVLNNKYTGQTTMRVHIDAQTHLVLERQQYAANGSLIAQTRMEQIRYTNAIPPALFDIPSGMDRVNGAARGQESTDIAQVISSAGFAARVPKYLPEGFSPIAGDLVSINNVPTLHLIYSDGIRTVSLFQNEKDAAVDLSHYHAIATSVADHPAHYVEDGPTTLLAWADGNRHFALVGELTVVELEKIGASVLP
ncbi:MAG: sigma-E factor regulatory protein RseB domain-containing protein [Candidatus Aquilonibacter sp.]|jgi:negative regulator of sigma E activity